MGVLEDLADGLARDALALEVDEDDPLVSQVGKTIGASSQTLEEAYLTAIRVRRADVGLATPRNREEDPTIIRVIADHRVAKWEPIRRDDNVNSLGGAEQPATTSTHRADVVRPGSGSVHHGLCPDIRASTTQPITNLDPSHPTRFIPKETCDLRIGENARPLIHRVEHRLQGESRVISGTVPIQRRSLQTVPIQQRLDRQRLGFREGLVQLGTPKHRQTIVEP